MNESFATEDDWESKATAFFTDPSIVSAAKDYYCAGTIDASIEDDKWCLSIVGESPADILAKLVRWVYYYFYNVEELDG